MKKKVVFFSRCNLGKMYALVAKYIGDDYDCFHIAYDDIEYNELVNYYGILESKVIHFKKNLTKYLNMNFDDNDLLLLENDILKATNGRFNLNQSIQSDRVLSYKSYDDCNKLAIALYRFWNDYFNEIKPIAIFHEMTSLLMNHICSVCAKKQNIYYVSEIQVPGINESNLLFCTYNGGIPVFMTHSRNVVNNAQVSDYIQEFRNAPSAVLMGNMFKTESLFKLKFKSIIQGFRNYKHKNAYSKLIDCIESFFFQENLTKQRLNNLKSYKKIKWDKFDSTKKYYYYPFHLEPEAAVFYWGDGLYANQIKLIENIAAQLPPDTYLYVKDHPHDIGYRNPEDYLKLQKIPNIKVLYAKEPGKDIIRNAKGVVTINGSAGFEAILLNKPVFYFGHPYYENSDRAFYIENIKELGKILKKDVSGVLKNEESLVTFVLSIFNNSFEGNTAVFYGNNISSEDNNQKVCCAFKNYLDLLKVEQKA